MADLKRLSNKVAYELENYPELRDDDFKLILAIYADFYEVGTFCSFHDIMMNHADYKLPSFESIRRTRQKLQEKYPGKYAGSENMKKIRDKEFDSFYEYAREIL